MESAFWVLFYWLMSARPANKANEEIDLMSWSLFVGECRERRCLTAVVYSRYSHSVFQPALSLVVDLGHYLHDDRFWLPEDDQHLIPHMLRTPFSECRWSFASSSRTRKNHSCNTLSIQRILVP